MQEALCSLGNRYVDNVPFWVVVAARGKPAPWPPYQVDCLWPEVRSCSCSSLWHLYRVWILEVFFQKLADE